MLLQLHGHNMLCFTSDPSSIATALDMWRRYSYHDPGLAIIIANCAILPVVNLNMYQWLVKIYPLKNDIPMNIHACVDSLSLNVSLQHDNYSIIIIVIIFTRSIHTIIVMNVNGCVRFYFYIK